MWQVVFGATLGVMLGEGVLQGAKYLLGRFRSVGARVPGAGPAPLQARAVLGGFIKYAGAMGAIAALITFSVWAVADYLAARSARRAVSAELAEPTALPAATQPPAPAAELADSSQGPGADLPGTLDEDADPYADAEFKVHRQIHRPGRPLSLKETLVERSEARARADLLKQTQEHMRRSQYDCETAQHASKYLDAGLDVWGFAAWQVKYFPVDGYKGATLAQCKDIKDVIDPSRVALQPPAADDNHS